MLPQVTTGYLPMPVNPKAVAVPAKAKAKLMPQGSVAASSSSGPAAMEVDESMWVSPEEAELAMDYEIKGRGKGKDDAGTLCVSRSACARVPVGAAVVTRLAIVGAQVEVKADFDGAAGHKFEPLVEFCV